MDIPVEAYEIIILVIVISVAMTVVGYFTKSSKGFRSRRNSKARKPL